MSEGYDMQDEKADIVVLAANPGGLCAAISAARTGKSVVVLEATSLVGGMNGNGVCGFDAARPAALSGLAKEFEVLVARHYEENERSDDPVLVARSDQVWEPAVNRACWQKLIEKTQNLSVRTGAVVVGARVEDDRISEILWVPSKDVFGTPDETNDPSILRPGIVIDASYESDILEFAGVPHRIGREPRSWQEPHAGRIYTSDMLPGKSGYMPHSVLPGSTGEGDAGVSAFSMRIPCKWYEDTSEDAAHRIASPPPDYDPAEFAWTPQGSDADGKPLWFKGNYLMVGGKFLLNRMVRGNELSEAARQYVLAHPRDRAVYRDQIMNYSRSYLYFIQTECGMPQLGPADDDFHENGGIPYQVYVRAGRRIEGAFTLTEAQVNPYIEGDGYRPPPLRNSIAIADWIFESHACVDHLEDGYNFPEGWVFGRVTQCPYQIPYECLLPKKVGNLLVCGSLSATHIGFSAVRCEATRMQTGIAAGLAASLCVEQDRAPAEIAVADLQREIVARGGKLVYFGDVESDHPAFREIQWAGLRGYLPQNDEWHLEADRHVTWNELVRTIVDVLGLPISVTGAHFEGVGRHHPSFRYLEALYDLGTRSDVDLFASKSLSNEDPLLAILRLNPAAKLIPFHGDRSVALDEARKFFLLLEQALFTSARPDWTTCLDTTHPLLTRAILCRVLFAFGTRDDHQGLCLRSGL